MMSRLCRLKTASHGDDGKWAYQEITSLRQQLAECQSELADQKRLCVDDEMVVDLPAGFKHRIKFQCDMLPLTDAELDDYVKSPFGIKNWIRKQLDRLSECERERDILKRKAELPMRYKRMEHNASLQRELAAVTKERDELAMALKELMKYTPRTEYIGGVENCYCVPTGTALCKVIDACEAAIAKLGADKTGEV